jgi:hypothetical protein
MRYIIVPKSKKELESFINNVNHEMRGEKMEVNENDFKAFWKTDMINSFYQKTGILIDDFETTIIDNANDVSTLKQIIAEWSKMSSLSNFSKKLVDIILSAEKNKSGIIFFF